MTRSGIAGCSALKIVSMMVIGKHHPPAHRRRPRRADDAARRDDDLEAAERAVVDRIVGRRGDALVGDLGAGVAGGDGGVVEAAHLLRHVGQVDGHLVALDGDLDLDRDALADLDAVVVERGLRLVDAVGNGLGARPRGGFGAVHDLGDRGHHLGRAVAVEQFEEAPLAGLHRGDLRAQVAHGARRQPHVHADDVEQVLVDLAAVLILQDRDLDAFGIDVGGHAAEHAADVEPVRHAAGEAGELALVEDRQREGEMVEVAAGDVGIVGDVDVARIDVLDAEMLDLGLHGLRHAADEHRQADADRDGLALRREQAGGEVQRLVDDHVVGGAHEVGLHFLGHGEDAVAHDLDDDRIDLAAVGSFSLLVLAIIPLHRHSGALVEGASSESRAMLGLAVWIPGSHASVRPGMTA